MPADPLDALRLPIVPVEPRPEFAEGLLRRMQSVDQTQRRATPTIRYFVKDMDVAVEFYRQHLGFEEELRPSSVFAMLYRDDLRLLLNVPGPHPGGHALADGTLPTPGGWNRILIQVADLDATVEALRRAGIHPVIRSSCSSLRSATTSERAETLGGVCASCLISSIQEATPDDAGYRHRSCAVHGRRRRDRR